MRPAVGRAALRVAVDARSLLCRHPRGEGKSLLRLYNTVLEQRSDLEVIFFGDSSASGFDRSLPDTIRVVILPTVTSRFNAWENLLFPLGAKIAGCNVMHCTSSGAPWRTLMPMVMTVHDLIPILFEDGQSAGDSKLFFRRLRRGLHQAAVVMTVSNHTCQDLLKTFPMLERRPHVVHWGAEPLIDRSPSAPGVPTVLVFGGEARRKNTDYTIDRFIGAAKRVPGLRLQLVGISSAIQRTAVQHKIEAAGLTGGVSMIGFVSEALLADMMRNSTLLLYLSLYEGFGLPLVEAIGCGLPVIASDRTSIPEILSSGAGCFDLSNPQAIEDAIVGLCVDARSRKRYAARQAALLPRFDWAVAAQSVLTALETAMAASRSAQTLPPDPNSRLEKTTNSYPPQEKPND
ncbi:MAG: glycosyltransferase family 4 protein [Rhizobacter sp.]|nr:glycosyltransferase family 4 protein [Rhizobacter sp.]